MIHAMPSAENTPVQYGIARSASPNRLGTAVSRGYKIFQHPIKNLLTIAFDPFWGAEAWTGFKGLISPGTSRLTNPSTLFWILC